MTAGSQRPGGGRRNSVARPQPCICSWMWGVEGGGHRAAGFRPALKPPGLRKGRDGPLGGQWGAVRSKRRNRRWWDKASRRPPEWPGLWCCGCSQQRCSFCLEVPELHTLFCSDHGALVCPLSSLHPIRSWHRQWELWKYHRALPLPWLFTGEVNKERDSAEQMLGPTGQPRRLMQRSHLHKQMPRGAAWKVSPSPKQTRTCSQT